MSAPTLTTAADEPQPWDGWADMRGEIHTLRAERDAAKDEARQLRRRVAGLLGSLDYFVDPTFVRFSALTEAQRLAAIAEHLAKFDGEGGAR